jgi:hypothetical protein
MKTMKGNVDAAGAAFRIFPRGNAVKEGIEEADREQGRSGGRPNEKRRRRGDKKSRRQQENPLHRAQVHPTRNFLEVVNDTAGLFPSDLAVSLVVLNGAVHDFLQSASRLSRRKLHQGVAREAIQSKAPV